jgi:hypothetical protein
MRFGLNELCLGALTTCLSTAVWAQSPVLDGETKETTGTPTEAQLDPTLNQTPEEAPVEYGVGIRLRNVRIPKALLELFVDRSAGGASSFGYGLELVRRRGTVELQLGFEFERLQVGEGVWINRGENVAIGDQADYILAPEHAPNGDQLGWFTIEFTFVNHSEINKNFAIRYGGGAGLGILTGALYRYDVQCVGATNANPEPGCVPMERGGTGVGSGPVKYDLPPVFPVVNAIIGVQIKPIDKMVINIEGGLRTAPFFGGTIGYFF